MKTKKQKKYFLSRKVKISICLGALMVVFSLAPSIRAGDSPASITDTAGAAVVNTGGKIYFDSIPFGSNVVIDNHSRKMSGYAWSEDLGWIDFGNSSSNPANPVVADTDGHLSGAADILNGGVIEFNTSPYGSNVVIANGVFSGFAWSEDLGWIDFSGVSAPTYIPDLSTPDNPSSIAARSEIGGDELTTNTWYNYSAPYFSWIAPSDNTTGATPSGIAGYYVYFGTIETADPSAYQEITTYTSPNLGSTFGTYYFRMKTKDNSGNISSAVTQFIYIYETAAPIAPSYVSVTPSGYTRANSFVFSWRVDGARGPSDTGGSGLEKYQYKINDEQAWHDVAGDETTDSITLTNIADTSVNTFDLRVVDHAGNVSTPPVRTNFYFNTSSPSAPRNVTAAPTSSETNSFAFSWTAPPGEIAGYYYSINNLPSAMNAVYTTAASLEAGPYATQQGENTFFVLAKDNAGNYDFSSCANITGDPTLDGCAYTTFTANTVAPSIPGNVQAYDISNRDAKDYAIAVKWTEPETTGIGFAGYDIYRSENNAAYSNIGSTTSTMYADGGLETKEYSYYVVAKDNANNFSAHSSTASLTPTGRFTSPPKLVSGPTAEINPTTLILRWVTDRVASSFVTIMHGNTFVAEQGQTEQTTSHEVKVIGLRSLENYVYTIKSVDIDGNLLVGPERSITTANTPSVYDVSISSITQHSAIISFKSTAVAHFDMHYGETQNFGKNITEDASSATTNHSIALSNLKPNQMYYYRITGVDADGNELRTENSFMTLPFPSISDFRIQPNKDAPSTTLEVSWITNVPTSSIVKYSSNSVDYSERSASDLVINHRLIISDLSDNKKYTIYASGRDGFGNTAESEKIAYDTPVDTRPPKISDIIIESSNVGNASDMSVQIAVSWKTDEPANSQVEFDAGISGSEYTRKTTLDAGMTNRHLVIISDLEPGMPYHIRLISSDPAGNAAYSKDNTVITGDITNSALQIILNTMQNIFGWMGGFIR